MSTKFFTNREGNNLLRKFEGVFANVPNLKEFDALVGYFRSSGYFKVRKFIDSTNIDKIRILVGINVDQLTQQFHQRGQKLLTDTDAAKAKLIEEIIEDIQASNYDAETENGIHQFLEDLSNEKLEMRTHPEKKLHAKFYIFRPRPFNEYSHSEVVTGSSNLTDSGLGAYEEANYEFNVSLHDHDDVKFATDEFNLLWEQSVPVLKPEAEAIKNKSYLKDNFTPHDIYIKMLMEYFGKRVDYDPYNIDLLLPEKYTRLKYQIDAANQGFAIMMKHNGFILADVVGLGKTVIACMIAKKFVYENGTHTRILLVIPPALFNSWKRTLRDFMIEQHVEVVTNGSLHHVLDEKNYKHPDPDRYDLVMVDESHKFRNDSSQMFDALQQICKVARSRPSEEGDYKKKVMLISATPLNNHPEDIENQLYLFQDPRNSTLDKVRNLQEFFKPLKDQYDKLKKEPQLDVKKVKRIFEQMRDGVVEQLVIRRTRKDIENSEEYREDLKKQKIEFPKIKGPESVHYLLDTKLNELFVQTVTILTGIDGNENEAEGLGYYRYRAIEFLLNEEDRAIYGDVKSISNRLSAIMKTLMVKRLESSFYAFRASLKRFQKATQNMIEMFERDEVFIAPDVDVNQYLQEENLDDLRKKIEQKGGNNRTFGKKAFDKNFLPLLKRDKKLIDELVEEWDSIGAKDPKWDEFLKQLKQNFLKAKNNPTGKLVLFSESKETADYLKDKMAAEGYDRVLCIDASNRKQMQTTITENFDANLPEVEWKNDYDFIITTEVLAEGVNLHRSNVILNYDVPWNATRLMQRIGRVNRIGSRTKFIYVYNFYPSAQADDEISLSNTALKKLQAFHTLFGEDNQIYSILEEVGEGALHGNQIIEEESEALKYLNELREFLKKHKADFKRIEKLPARARCGRDTNAVTKLPIQGLKLSDGTIAYLKSKDHPGLFYWIGTNKVPAELSFLEAVKLFKAEMDEKKKPLHELHHVQVSAALNYFETESQQQQVQRITRKSLAPAENKAIGNLQSIIKLLPTDQKKKVLLRTIEVIKDGGVRKLVKDINDRFVTLPITEKDWKVFIEKLFNDVLDKQVLPTIDENTLMKDGTRLVQKPFVVISESFI